MAALLNVALIALDDKELYECGHPLPLDQILKLIKCFKMILFLSLKCDPSVLAEPIDVSTAAVTSNDPLLNLDASMQSMNRLYRFHAMKSILGCLQNLFVRWVRRPFSYADLWEIDEATSRRFLQSLSSGEDFARSVIAHMPWCIPFHQRMLHFRTVLDAERQSIQGSDTDPLYRSRGTVVSIRRAMVLEDGMQSLARVGAAGIKDRIVVRYINEFGEEEKGIDAGGLFKDFWNDLSRFVFDPSFGLFAITSDNLLYPNPNSVALYSKEELEKMYFFVGRILGKALFENLTVQPQFTHFFLAFISGRYNFMNLIDDLATLDAELYKNLMFLKSYEGDIGDLALTFTVSENAFGSQKDVDLVPGGANIDVTRQNRHRYINAVAKYYLHDRIFIQARSFFMGLHEVIRPDLLNMFCSPELQVLISGTSTGVSFDDLKANTHYASGYHALDRTILMFWAVVKDMSESDRALLLKFVTSCERPPSLGFSSLHPPFTVQRVASEDDSRLPTASTCFNVLKLPNYSSQAVLKEKLLLAIRSKSGFDLS
jgi:ubiquitin-protein ligase E3 C